MPSHETSLPIVVACRADLAEEVERHLEGVLGWQSIGEAADWVRPVAVLSDGTDSAVDLPRDVPVILVLAPSMSSGEGARRAVALGACAVLAWPDERDQLPALVAGLPGSSRTDIVDHRLVIAGSSGGVGTTTVALALGGLLAWARRDVLALVCGDVPMCGVPLLADASLDGPGVWPAAAIAPGVPGLRVIARLSSESTVPAVLVPAGVIIVADVGVHPEGDLPDLLVARRDRAGQEAIASSAAGGIVLLDDGPLEESEVLEAAGGRVVAVLPRSARVARAGAGRQIPAGLPASWLAPLRGFTDPFTS
ncbi:MAG: hypothetical protein ACI867_000353 [Glaciecola sp.]|jgi:hypothetical protein